MSLVVVGIDVESSSLGWRGSNAAIAPIELPTAMVFVPTSTLDAPGMGLTTVPATVIAVAFGRSVYDEITYLTLDALVGPCVTVWVVVLSRTA